MKALRKEVHNAPEWKKGTDWHADRLAEIHAVTQHLRAIEENTHGTLETPDRHTITIELTSVQLAMFARISAIDGIADLMAALKDQARQYVVVAYRDILNYKEKAVEHIWKGDFAG